MAELYVSDKGFRNKKGSANTDPFLHIYVVILFLTTKNVLWFENVN
jgi:hypothetical protein